MANPLELELTSSNISQSDAECVKEHLLSILRRLGATGRLNIELIMKSEKEIATLNHQYLGNNQPTDVLSFPSDHPESLGSTVICPTIAKSQAVQGGISFMDEMKMLSSHGLLHLLGYHHT